MNKGVQWKSDINNKPLAYILISELVAKYHADTDIDTDTDTDTDTATDTDTDTDTDTEI